MRYNYFIQFGIIIWIASYISERIDANLISTFGIYASFLFNSIGIFGWFKIQYQNGYIQRLKIEIKDNLNRIGTDYVFSFKFIINHLIEIWVFMIFIWITVSILLSLIFKQTNEFKKANDYVTHNKVVQNNVGEIYLTGAIAYMDFNYGKNKTFINYSIIAEKANVEIELVLNTKNNRFKVENLYMDKVRIEGPGKE